MSVLNLTEFLSTINQFPCKLSLPDGIRLKQFFEQENVINKCISNTKSIRYKYRKKIAGTDYLLLEEYLFREGDTILDIKHAIAVNYYLNRLDR